jgi:hypothetical protein
MQTGEAAINYPERITGKASQLCAQFALAALLCLGTVPATFGCGLHAPLGVRLDGMYPGSLSVAVALRGAADNGLIDAADLEAPGSGAVLYIDSVRRLHAFRTTLAASPAVADLPASFSLGYVESRLWTRYSQSGGEVQVEVHTDGPGEGEAVVLTGEPVLAELLAGRLSLDRALSEGLILIDADEGKKTAIRHALMATPMASTISSR